MGLSPPEAPHCPQPVAPRAAAEPMLYSRSRPHPASANGGNAILEVLRQTGGRLVHKQWLILYPLAVGIINIVAFVAVYAATGRKMAWTPFLQANFDRWQFVSDNYVADLSFTPDLAIAAIVGLGVCILAAMIRAPYFRAVAVSGYPLAPRGWAEVGRLSLFYLFTSLVSWVLPFAGLASGWLQQSIAFVVLVVAILVIFADYVIVFEHLGFVAGLRRSLRLVTRGWVAVILIFIIVQLVYFGLHVLYRSYYDGAEGVLIALPIVQLIVDAFIVLVVDLILIFFYERLRRTSHS